MAEELQCQVATDEQKLAAFTNVHEFWGAGRTLEDHLQHRLASRQHRRATWYVGLLNGRVVASLGCFPMDFHVHGQLCPGIAIGAVHTHPEFRRRGFARHLIEWLEQHVRDAGAQLSLLYSDIDPAYYARLGYQRCPSHEGWADPVVDDNTDGWQLVRCDPATAAPQLQRLYDRHHAGRTIAVARNSAYWQYLVEKSVEDHFYWLEDLDGQCRGFARVQVGDDLRVVDYALTDTNQELLAQLYRQLLRCATPGPVGRVGGWLPDCPAAREWFQVVERPKEITMIKLLPVASEAEWHADKRINQATLLAADWFLEIDHV
jgi:predicted N-acetyltransferase YhbS